MTHFKANEELSQNCSIIQAGFHRYDSELKLLPF